LALANDHTRDSASRYEPCRRPPRRAFLKLSATAAAASLAGCSSTADRTAQSGAAKVTPASPLETERFNYILGTQSIGATCQFTEETLMVEVALATLDLGSNRVLPRTNVDFVCYST
jgi:hypothetical protein